MGKPFIGFTWISFFLCASLVLGLPGCASHKTTIVSRLTLFVKEDSFNRKNIGLVGDMLSVDEDVTLHDVPNPVSDTGILLQMVQGVWYGAVSGFEAGQIFCWSGSGNAGRDSIHLGNASREALHWGNAKGAEALILLILCGGGIATGVSIGAALGLVTPLVSSPHPPEILIAREHVIQGVWKVLTARPDQEGSSRSHLLDEAPLQASPRRSVAFGEEDQPFTAFLRMDPIQVGLFSRSPVNADVLALLWNVRVVFFDHRHRVVAKQLIEIEQGEYSFEQWAEYDARLLQEKLRDGYRLVAEQIVIEMVKP